MKLSEFVFPLRGMTVLWFVFLITTLLIISVTAQPLPYSLSGHIYDNESEYIIGAEITLINERTNDVLVLVSTTNGEYQQDAYNFAGHYKNGDTIRYNITYEDIGAVELKDIDISKGGTKLDIVLTKEGSPATTPNPTPKSKAPHKTTTHMYTDTDGDGISDNEERVRGWDKLDPCIPNSDSFACKAKMTQTHQLTPEVFSPFVEEPTPIPTLKATPKTTPKIIATPKTVDIPKRIPGFIGLEFLIVALLFLYKRGKDVK